MKIRTFLDPQRFAGRRAIVTGAASGIGFAVARRIVAEGGQVALWDVNGESLAAARGSLVGGHVDVVDVTKPADVAAATEHAAALMGGVDILVTSAGVIGRTAPLHEYAIDEWRRVFSINVDGVFHCCRAVVPHMLEQGYGRIVTVASVAGKEGNPNASAYSASKAAVIGLTKALGKELARSGICANSVAPAALETAMLESIPDEQLEYMKSKIPMHRLGTPDECASLICFMASEECSFSTGAVFDLSGGRATY